MVVDTGYGKLLLIEYIRKKQNNVHGNFVI